MLNLTILEREYLIKLIKEDEKSKQPLSNEFYIDTNKLIQYIEQSHFVDTEEEEIDYCPGCNIAHCRGRYTTGQCE